ncbi:hypothetical protein QFC19_006234 [Naganishia cerealis]|uniref:Uncharacterized protein n=1 Tax=Naganishia cerealis TaxID=610337 RepID=A0ACC2VJ12_9TREE|nr:hypothetical protein QFC19_006234 [Naganishia cerealis]
MPAVLPSKETIEAYDMQLDYDCGVNGSPGSSLEMPLHEHLSRNFPSSPPLSTSSLPLAPPRPHFARTSSRRSSNASSRLASPLRQEVIEEEPDVALEEAMTREPETTIVPEPLAANKHQRSSFLSAMKSVGRSSSKWEKREKEQVISPPTTPEPTARPTSSFKRHKSDHIPSAPSSSRDLGATISRPGTSSALSSATWQRTPSIRSSKSYGSQTLPFGGQSHTVPSNGAKSLWTDSVPVIATSDRPATPPRSPGKVYEEFPEIVDPAHNGSLSNTPKFSRSAMKKNGVMLPMPSPKSPSHSQASSPLGSPWQSPSSGSRMTLGRSRSILSLDTFSILHERLADTSSPSVKTALESDYFTALEQARAHEELPIHPTTFRPKLRSKVSTSSINSSISAYSFRTACESKTKSPADTPSTPSSPEGCHILSPIPSNISTSDGTRTFSDSCASSSDSSHTRSSTSTSSSIGDARKQSKKTGGLKRFLKMFGMTRAGDLTAVA